VNKDYDGAYLVGTLKIQVIFLKVNEMYVNIV
jgi:hypothetical protein